MNINNKHTNTNSNTIFNANFHKCIAVILHLQCNIFILYLTVKTFTIFEKKLGSPSASKIRKLEIRCKKIYHCIRYRQIIITSTWSDSRIISETFGVPDVIQQDIYYFQWKFWPRTIPIYKVFYCKIFKSFSLHSSLVW